MFEAQVLGQVLIEPLQIWIQSKLSCQVLIRPNSQVGSLLYVLKPPKANLFLFKCLLQHCVLQRVLLFHS